MAGITREQRPFRVYDEKAKLDLPHRSYKEPQRAIERCLVLLYALELGNSYTVYDARSSRAILQVTRKVDGLRWYVDQPKKGNGQT